MDLLLNQHTFRTQKIEVTQLIIPDIYIYSAGVLQQGIIKIMGFLPSALIKRYNI